MQNAPGDVKDLRKNLDICFKSLTLQKTSEIFFVSIC